MKNKLTILNNGYILRVTRPCTPLNNASHVGLFFCPFEMFQDKIIIDITFNLIDGNHSR